MIRKILVHTMLLCAALYCVAAAALAQANDPPYSLSCRDQNNSYTGERARHCEVKEQTLAATGGALKVDGMQNGGISIKGWERNEILVRYRVQTQAPTQAEADHLASRIRVT